MKKAEKKTRVCAYKHCPREGKPFEMNGRGRPKQFCSANCQLAQWNDQHPRINLAPGGSVGGAME